MKENKKRGSQKVGHTEVMKKLGKRQTRDNKEERN